MLNNFDLIVFTSGPLAYAPRRVAEEALKLGLSATTIKYREISFQAKNNQLLVLYNGAPMPKARGIFVRGLGEDTAYNPTKHLLVSWFESYGAKVLNARSFNEWSSLDKISQHIEFLEAGIPVCDSWVFGSLVEADNWVRSAKIPFIVKASVGSCGEEVYKINDVTDWIKLIAKGYSTRTIKSLLFQTLLPEASDLRVIVIGGKVIGAMKRVAQKDQFLTNFSQGGSVETYNVTQDASASAIALKVADHFHLDYCGVDLMKNALGEWIVLEVNRACQFKGFEKATGINVAKEVVDFLTS